MRTQKPQSPPNSKGIAVLCVAKRSALQVIRKPTMTLVVKYGWAILLGDALIFVFYRRFNGMLFLGMAKLHQLILTTHFESSNTWIYSKNIQYVYMLKIRLQQRKWSNWQEHLLLLVSNMHLFSWLLQTPSQLTYVVLLNKPSWAEDSRF